MTDAPHTVKVRLRVEGMDCASCAIKIETALHRLAGVSDVVVSVPAGTVIVTHDRRVFDAKNHTPIATKGYSAAVLIVGGAGRETVTLAPQGENSLKGDAKNPIAAGATITLTIKTAEGKSGQAKFKK